MVMVVESHNTHHTPFCLFPPTTTPLFPYIRRFPPLLCKKKTIVFLREKASQKARAFFYEKSLFLNIGLKSSDPCFASILHKTD